jgi:hypothetical protein
MGRAGAGSLALRQRSGFCLEVDLREISFSIDCRRTSLVARQDLGVDEKNLEHGVGHPDGWEA